MPTQITRYVMFEVAKVFAATVTALVLLLVLVGVLHEGIRNGLTPPVMAKLIPFTLPNAVCLALPGSMLFAVCNVFGRISAANEIVAIKSLGISPNVVVVPALVFASLISTLDVWLTDVAFCWGYHGVQRVIISSIRETAYGVLRTKRDFSTHGISFHVNDVQDDRLIDPLIVARAGQQTITISAREARLRPGNEPSILMLSLTDGSVEAGEQRRFVFPDTIEYPLNIGFTGDGPVLAHPSHIWSHQIRGEMRDQRQRIASLEETLAVQAAFQMTAGDFPGLTAPSWKGDHQRLAAERYRLQRLGVEPWRRWASGFSCLSFALVGIPLAIRMRNSDFLTSFFLCFMPILLVYYPLFAYGLGRAKAAALPPYSVWLGNVVCIVVGLLMLRQIQRR